MKVYLAGPMAGYPGHNFPAFDAAEEEWTRRGHIVFSPARMSRALPIDQLPLTDVRRMCLLNDIMVIYQVDAIALLQGWERSLGTTVEVALAQYLGLLVLDAETMEPLGISIKPWYVLARDSDEDDQPQAIEVRHVGE